MKCKMICYICSKMWDGHPPNPTEWGIVYDWCGTCRKRMFEQFERQFSKSKRIRVEGQ